MAIELAHGRTLWRVEKFHEDIDRFDGSREKFLERFRPYEVVEIEGNILVNAGIDLILDLLIGAGGTVFSNANAYLGVGDSSTAASTSQTDLQGSNKTRKAMDATYPSRTGETLTFHSTFGGGDANHAWNEWAIFNASSSGTMLNRKVQSFGTKASGTWTLAALFALS